MVTEPVNRLFSRGWGENGAERKKRRGKTERRWELTMKLSLVHNQVEYLGHGKRVGAVVRTLASHQWARVRFLDPASYVSWVCWFSSLLREVFLRVTRFTTLLKKPTFPNSNSIWIFVKHLIMSLWLGWSRKHSLCLTFTFTFTLLCFCVKFDMMCILHVMYFRLSICRFWILTDDWLMDWLTWLTDWLRFRNIFSSRWQTDRTRPLDKGIAS